MIYDNKIINNRQFKSSQSALEFSDSLSPLLLPPSPPLNPPNRPNPPNPPNPKILSSRNPVIL